MGAKMPVEVRNAQQEIMQMLRQFRLDQELETMDFIEIRNRFLSAFKLLAICLDKPRRSSQRTAGKREK